MQAIRPMGAQILMGKNTLMKRCIRLYCENKKDDAWGALLEDLVGNIGVLFVRDDFKVSLPRPLHPGIVTNILWHTDVVIWCIRHQQSRACPCRTGVLV